MSRKIFALAILAVMILPGFVSAAANKSQKPPANKSASQKPMNQKPASQKSTQQKSSEQKAPKQSIDAQIAAEEKKRSDLAKQVQDYRKQIK